MLTLQCFERHWGEKYILVFSNVSLINWAKQMIVIACTLRRANKIKKIFYKTAIFILFNVINIDAKSQAVCDIEQIKKREFSGMLFSIKEGANLLGYLFGGIHQGYEPIKALPKPVEIALSRSKKVYVEWFPNSPGGEQQELDVLFPERSVRNLKMVLNDRNYKTLGAHLDKLNLTSDARINAESLHPNKLIPDLIDPSPLALNNSASLDNLIMLSSIEHGLKFDGIESTQEHWLPIAAVTTDEEINLLAGETLRELPCDSCREERRQMGLCTLELTRVGEADQLILIHDKFHESRPVAKAHFETVVLSRNVGMAKKIASLLGKEPPFFISIGALHLGGKMGVIQHLRDLGYTVEKVTE